MKKLILALLFFFTIMFSCAQKEEPLHDNAVLIGYISSSDEEFINVVLYIDELNNRVIDICKEDGLILFQVCEEWKDVRNFVKWVEDISNWEEGLTLDRIDTNGNYSPENCTFSDKTHQSINQRMQSNNTSGFVGVNWQKAKQRWRARV